MDTKKEEMKKEKWLGLSVEEIAFEDIEKHISVHAISGGSGGCSSQTFNGLFC